MQSFYQFLQLLPFTTALALTSCNNHNAQSANNQNKPMNIKEETVAYTSDTLTMNGFVAYNDADTAKRPVVLIVHEWWGLNDYAKGRAKQLAALGYLTMAIDMYGNGQTVESPQDAGALATPFYKDPQLAKAHFDAALAKIKTYPQADTNNIAAIGYCFGGGMVLNMARLGEDLKGVVSFHGSLLGVPADNKTLKADILVCHGADDQFVKPEEVAAFKKELDSLGIAYTFKSYEGATHAFSNPGATEKGKKYALPIAYNAAADTASFNEMISFFGKVFK